MRGRNAAWCVAASVAVAAVFGVQGSHMEMSDEDVNIWPAWHNCRRYLLVRDRLFPPPKGEVYLLWGVRGVDRSGASAWNEDDLGQVDLPVSPPHLHCISLYLPISPYTSGRSSGTRASTRVRLPCSWPCWTPATPPCRPRSSWSRTRPSAPSGTPNPNPNPNPNRNPNPNPNPNPNRNRNPNPNPNPVRSFALWAEARNESWPLPPQRHPYLLDDFLRAQPWWRDQHARVRVQG